MARIEQSIEVNVPVSAAYDQLTQFEQYPRFIQDVDKVRQLDDTHLYLHSRRGGLDMEWEAEITQRVPGRCIAWRNTSGPKYEGRIELHSAGDDGTRVTLTVECDPKQQVLAQHGDAESAIAQHTENDLARFKKFMEKLGREAGELHPMMSDTQRASATERSPGRIEHGRFPVLSTQEIFKLWYEPFGLMRRMSEDMVRLVARMPYDTRRLPANGDWTPAIEIAQRANQIVICAELAGVRREDVQVEVSSECLTIEGERRQQAPREAREARSSERTYGRFHREVALPPGADPNAASAELHDGVLEVTVPVARGGEGGRKVEVRGGR